MNNCTVYLHINKINNKKYIGQTGTSVEKRWKSNGQGYKNQPYFWKAIQKYGWDNFEHIILETNLSQEEADEREKYWIKYYNSNDSDFGYNQTEGGNFGSTSKEANEKRLAYWTEEKRLKKSEELKKRWQEDKEWGLVALNALRNASRPDMSGSNNPMYGTHRTGKDAARKRKVQCIETGEIFETIIEAARWSSNNKTPTSSHIGDVCRGKRKTSGKHPITNQPLTWRYVEE